ncbi:pyridoxamine 5'-phosphate oxidase [Myxococcota bacterium]|nr:pyridoxamine 5'-phosphate oxidase [Myxococcota bacterium]
MTGQSVHRTGVIRRYSPGMTEALPDAWLSRDPLPEDPLSLLVNWLGEAFDAGLQPNPHAMALATSNASGSPSVRMVLCQKIDRERSCLTFYTHMDSRKGKELADLPRAAAVFYWSGQNRQARVEGPVTQLPDAESDDYFATRPTDARIGAWASSQSAPISSREALLQEIERTAQRFDVSLEDPAATVPRPPTWGGYALHAETVELWVSRPARIHDRAIWHREIAPEPSLEPSTGWQVTRLQP